MKRYGERLLTNKENSRVIKISRYKIQNKKCPQLHRVQFLNRRQSRNESRDKNRSRQLNHRIIPNRQLPGSRLRRAML